MAPRLFSDVRASVEPRWPSLGLHHTHTTLVLTCIKTRDFWRGKVLYSCTTSLTLVALRKVQKRCSSCDELDTASPLCQEEAGIPAKTRWQLSETPPSDWWADQVVVSCENITSWRRRNI